MQRTVTPVYVSGGVAGSGSITVINGASPKDPTLIPLFFLRDLIEVMMGIT
jgi:hypothetical protein